MKSELLFPGTSLVDRCPDNRGSTALNSVVELIMFIKSTFFLCFSRSTDPIPKYSDIAILQRKWNDGAALLIAVNDNGDISFQSLNSISLPLLTPHED
ncbi:hypothetical protein AVEN_251862-1 [Araneus ventricosus]|uniref:Uncharacterized protein n=1 Tax=Araneus ventricosus TaxID=182803 RepID=A0A4Y2U3T6_ARAVE|nr:hypothetical protein AVEN_251862-1 [Araneus ventricosus]